MAYCYVTVANSHVRMHVLKVTFVPSQNEANTTATHRKRAPNVAVSSRGQTCVCYRGRDDRVDDLQGHSTTARCVPELMTSRHNCYNPNSFMSCKTTYNINT